MKPDKLRISKLIGIASVLMLPYISVAAEFVGNPLWDAETLSKLYAEGDTNDASGWEGCYHLSQSTDVQPVIECTGQRTILFHGGEEVTYDFVCRYEYEEFAGEDQGYMILSSDCYY